MAFSYSSWVTSTWVTAKSGKPSGRMTADTTVTGFLSSGWGIGFLLSIKRRDGRHRGLGGQTGGSGGLVVLALLLLLVERGDLAEPLLEPGVLEVPVPQRPTFPTTSFVVPLRRKRHSGRASCRAER